MSPSDRARSIASPRDLAPWAFVAGLVLLSLAWAFGNAPFSSPDETQHYLRAIGVGQGDLIGPKRPYPEQGLTRAQHAWVEQAARGVHVPLGLNPTNSDCAAQHPELSAACVSTVVVPLRRTEVVQVGNYQPTAYALPGVFMLRSRDPVKALFLGRVASLLETLPFFVAGVTALTFRRRHNAVAITGVALALTPSVVFLAASVNPSGLEIAAGFAFAAGLFRLSERPGPRTWALVGASGLVLGVSRSPGAVWIAALTALFVMWRVPRQTMRLVRGSPRMASATGAALAVGVISNRWWEASYGSHVSSVVPSVSEVWSTARALLPLMSHEAIGVFGYQNIWLASRTYWLWESLVLFVAVLGFCLSSGYRRLVLVASLLALGVLPALQFFFVTTRTGYPVQARHLLPVLIVVPILAAEAVRTSTTRWGASLSRWSALALVPIAGVHGIAWWTNARRAAVGRGGPRLFLHSATWQPPLGWYPWTLLAVIGVALIVGAAVLAVWGVERGEAATTR